MRHNHRIRRNEPPHKTHSFVRFLTNAASHRASRSIDKAHFTLQACAVRGKQDGSTQRLRVPFDVCRVIAGSDDEATMLIAADEIDMSGHRVGSRLLAFVRKPALPHAALARRKRVMTRSGFLSSERRSGNGRSIARR